MSAAAGSVLVVWVALVAGALPTPAVAQSYLTAPASPLVPAPQGDADRIERLLRAGQAGEALALAQAVSADEPRNVRVRFLRALALGDLGRRAEAIAAFETLVREYPELPEPYNNLAVLLAGEGRLEEARALLQQCVNLQPDYLTALENLGDLGVALAADAYRRAVALAPADRTLQAKLALARETGAKLRTAR